MPNQYHVYNFGEAAGNFIGGPAYYYPSYPADPYYLTPCTPESTRTVNSDQLSTEEISSRLLGRLWESETVDSSA